METIPKRLPGVGELSPPRIKDSVFHASRDVRDIEYELVQLDDRRLHGAMRSLGKNEVVVRAFQLRFPEINCKNVSQCTHGSLKVRWDVSQSAYDIRGSERRNGVICRVLQTTPIGDTVCWTETGCKLKRLPVVGLEPFAGWKMFAVTEIQATAGMSQLISVDAGGRLSVLTSVGMLMMEVPPNALTQWPGLEVEFSVAMDINVLEFEAENGEMGLTSPVVECQPSGMCFKELSPVLLSVPLLGYSTVLERFPNHVPEVWVSDSSNRAWHPLLDSHGRATHPTIKKTANGTYLATFTTPHFTRFGVLFRNRIADLLGMVSLYKYNTASMISHISKLMDMPDTEGRRLFTLRLDFLINNADNATSEEFRQLTPYSCPIRLPYGDVRVSLDSRFIQPTANQQFERRIPFYEDHPCSVQFECQTAESCEDMITPEMVLAAVRVSRWRNGSFTNDPVPLKKIRCDEEWDRFRRTVNTKTVSDIIHREGTMRAFKQLCRSRLSLRELETREADNPFSQEDNDFVGAVARLFAQQGGTPEQFSKALIENLQNERINVELDQDVNSVVNSHSSSDISSILPDVREPDQPLSYAAAVVTDETTGPVSHSDFDKSIYRSLRDASRGLESSQLSSDADHDEPSTRGTKRKRRGKVTPENRHCCTKENMPCSPSVSPHPKIAPPEHRSDNTGTESHTYFQHEKQSISTTRECWTPEQQRRHFMSPYLETPRSRPPSHKRHPHKLSSTVQAHLPAVHKTNAKGMQSHNTEERVRFPPLVSNMRDNATTSGELIDIPGMVTRDASHEEGHQCETDSNSSQESDQTAMPSDREEKTFCASGQYVMSGYDQKLSVKHVTRNTINIVHCYGIECPHGSSSEDVR